MQADQATVEYLPVDVYGWVIESEVLIIQWDTPEKIAHITDIVKQLTSGCSCKKGCKNKRRECYQAHHNCSVGCKCASCENPQQTDRCSDSQCTLSTVHHDLSDQSHAAQVRSSECNDMFTSQPNTLHDTSDQSHAVLSSECSMLSSQPKFTNYCDELTDIDSDDSESQSDEEVDFAQGRDKELDFGLLNSSERKT